MVELCSHNIPAIPSDGIQVLVELRSQLRHVASPEVVEHLSHDNKGLVMLHKRAKRSGTDGHLDHRGQTDGWKGLDFFLWRVRGGAVSSAGWLILIRHKSMRQMARLRWLRFKSPRLQFGLVVHERMVMHLM